MTLRDPAAPAENMLGRVIASYRIVRRLASGGMGDVYLAEHLDLPLYAAVKVRVHDGALRFEREAEIAARMRSPHAVHPFHYGTTEGLHFIMMEHFGQDLKQQIKVVGRPFSLEEVVSIVEQAAEALVDAHDLGIIHRDVKPENILIAKLPGGFFVKLCDFGVALDDPESIGSFGTTTNDGPGTVAFQSPEQCFTPKAIDSRADLWSLAATAYYALFEVPPFDKSALSNAYSKQEVHFIIPSELRPEIPRAVDDWFTRTFDAKLENRFGDALEMAAALRRAAASVPRPIVPAEPATLEGEDRVESAPRAEEPAPSVSPTPTAASPVGRFSSRVMVLLAAVTLGAALFLTEPQRTPAASSSSTAPPKLETAAESPLVASSPNDGAPPMATSNAVTSAAGPGVHVVTPLSATRRTIAAAATPQVGSAETRIESPASGPPGASSPTATPGDQSCNPPYTIEDNIKKYKKECL